MSKPVKIKWVSKPPPIVRGAGAPDANRGHGVREWEARLQKGKGPCYLCQCEAFRG